MKKLTKASLSERANERELHGRDVAYRAACESIVLLKNEGALPFKGKRIAAFGSGVSRTIKGGTGSGEVNERRSVTILEGLKTRGFEVTTEKWIGDYETEYEKAYEKFKSKGLRLTDLQNLISTHFQPPSGRAVAVDDIKFSGTENCIYVVSRQAGEGGDRRLTKGDYLLTDTELADIRLCAENYKHFVLILNAGSGIDMGFLQDVPDIDAILFISQLGSEGGLAVADVLSGTVTPSGKLADTWAKQYWDIPYAEEYSYLNSELDDEYYKEGIYVGYRYFDSFGVEPLYPFGFGMSYTAFRLGKAELTVEGTGVTVRLRVKNTGRKFSGKETVQLYVSPPSGGLDKEHQRLAAFAKTPLLAPGESQDCALCFDLSRMASFRFEDASYVLEKGDYAVRLGTSSRDTAVIAVLRLDREVIISRHRHICPVKNPFIELKREKTAENDPPDVPVIALDAAAFTTEVCRYAVPDTLRDSRVRRFVDSLSIEEMAELVVGVGMNGSGRFMLPGAVGCTSSKFWDRGLANVALCDGPAGLRILRRAARNKKGEIKPLDMVFSYFELLPAFVQKAMLGDEKKDTILYQYATAFPVESALAQSWNTELLREIGEAVGDEMLEYGCTWWLAPAVNIHRNPLCGRNFEYFSEDPLLSGALAAAITQGVQSREGCYVTVKHLACNNQEDNRMAVCSNVSERALREIYLTAFELAVKDGGAKGIMTSYNRVNGVYSPNNYDLCTAVLRNEWGFEGVVMTDWFSTSKQKNGAALAMKAGNDLIMPGEPIARADIVRGIKQGIIEKEDLRRCCCNVVRAILDSAIQKEYIGQQEK